MNTVLSLFVEITSMGCCVRFQKILGCTATGKNDAFHIKLDNIIEIEFLISFTLAKQRVLRGIPGRCWLRLYVHQSPSPLQQKMRA
jgi:hypothetical protein